jgi:hypothetical protein
MSAECPDAFLGRRLLARIGLGALPHAASVLVGFGT